MKDDIEIILEMKERAIRSKNYLLAASLRDCEKLIIKQMESDWVELILKQLK